MDKSWIRIITYHQLDGLSGSYRQHSLAANAGRSITIRWTILTCAQKLTSSQLNMSHTTKQRRIMKKLKTKKTEMLIRNGPVVNEVRGVSPEAGRESMVGKICERGRSWAGSERGSYGWWEWWVDRVRCGRSTNRQDRDRGAEIRLMERTRKLIPETRWGIPKGAISYT